MSRSHTPEAVVTTRASGGVGRAAAVTPARRVAHIGLLAGGRGSLVGAAWLANGRDGHRVARPAWGKEEMS